MPVFGTTKEVGFGPEGAAEGLHNLTVGERMQLRLQDSRLGTSAAVQHLMKEYMLGNQIPTQILYCCYCCRCHHYPYNRRQCYTYYRLDQVPEYTYFY